MDDGWAVTILDDFDDAGVCGRTEVRMPLEERGVPVPPVRTCAYQLVEEAVFKTAYSV